MKLGQKWDHLCFIVSRPGEILKQEKSKAYNYKFNAFKNKKCSNFRGNTWLTEVN